MSVHACFDIAKIIVIGSIILNQLTSAVHYIKNHITSIANMTQQVAACSCMDYIRLTTA